MTESGEARRRRNAALSPSEARIFQALLDAAPAPVTISALAIVGAHPGHEPSEGSVKSTVSRLRVKRPEMKFICQWGSRSFRLQVRGDNACDNCEGKPEVRQLCRTCTTAFKMGFDRARGILAAASFTALKIDVSARESVVALRRPIPQPGEPQQPAGERQPIELGRRRPQRSRTALRASDAAPGV